MKNIQMILINLGLLISLSFCKTNNAVEPVSASKTEQNMNITATKEEVAAIKSILIGKKWVYPFPHILNADTCNVAPYQFSFTQDSVFSISALPYQIIAKDSIFINGYSTLIGKRYSNCLNLRYSSNKRDVYKFRIAKDSLSVKDTMLVIENILPSPKANIQNDNVYLIKSCTSNIDIQGTWIEKYPLKFDSVGDTLVFSKNGTIENHFYFKTWNYQLLDNNLIFSNSFLNKTLTFSVVNIKSNEIEIQNFIDRSITSNVKNIVYTKIN
jgi:hypothetical protein